MPVPIASIAQRPLQKYGEKYRGPFQLQEWLLRWRRVVITNTEMHASPVSSVRKDSKIENASVAASLPLKNLNSNFILKTSETNNRVHQVAEDGEDLAFQATRWIPRAIFIT